MARLRHCCSEAERVQPSPEEAVEVAAGPCLLGAMVLRLLTTLVMRAFS